MSGSSCYKWEQALADKLNKSTDFTLKPHFILNCAIMPGSSLVPYGGHMPSGSTEHFSNWVNNDGSTKKKPKKKNGGARPQRCVADGLREARRLDIKLRIHLPRRKLAAIGVAALRPAGNEDWDGINLGPGSKDVCISLQSCTRLESSPSATAVGKTRG